MQLDVGMRRMDRWAQMALLCPSRIQSASDRRVSSKDGQAGNTRTKADVLLAVRMPDDMQYHQQIHRQHSVTLQLLV
jgi:hypothetical protein